MTSVVNTIDFELTADDLLAFQRRHFPKWRRVALLSLSLLAVLVGVPVFLTYGMDSDDAFVRFSGGLCAVICVSLGVSCFWKSTPRRRPIERALKSGTSRRAMRQRVEISVGSFVVLTEAVSIRLPWRSIWDIQCSDDCLYVYQDAAHAYLIPKRAFPDPSVFEDFIVRVRGYRSQAPPLVDRCPRCNYDLTRASQEGCPECGWRRDNVTS